MVRRRLFAPLLLAAAALSGCGEESGGSGLSSASDAQDEARSASTTAVESFNDGLDCDDNRRSSGTGDFGAAGPPDPARATPLGALRHAVATRESMPTPELIAPSRTDGYWRSEDTPSTWVVWLDIDGRTKARFDLRLHGANWAVAGSLICPENER